MGPDGYGPDDYGRHGRDHWPCPNGTSTSRTTDNDADQELYVLCARSNPSSTNASTASAARSTK